MAALTYKIWFTLKCKLLRDDIRINGWTKEAYARIQGHIINLVAPTSEDEIFEFGCGTGLHLDRISKLCKKITGLDHLKAMVIKARNNNRRNANVYVIRYGSTGGAHLPFRDNSFSKIFSWSVFEYLPAKSDAEKLLNEFYRIAKPGGIIFIGDMPLVRSKRHIRRPIAARNNSAGQFVSLFNRFGYLHFDPDLVKGFCEPKFGESRIIHQDRSLPDHQERFDILIKVRK